MAMVMVAVALLKPSQLARQLARNQIDAGVKVFASLLGADHRAIGEHRDFSGLLRNPGVASD